MKIEGFEEADANLEALAALSDAEALVALGIDALQPVADTARGIVRRRTGRLAQSIGVGTRLSPRQAALSAPERGTVEIYVGPGSMPQAITEEFGTVNEAGHPYLRPAWDTRLADVLARLRQGAATRLQRITKG